jgi:hypothetical protein
MRWTVTILVLAGLVAGPAMAGAAAELQPHMAGWERIFTLQWQPGQWQGRPVVEGYVNNVSPYSLQRIGLLVDSLDASGRVTSQQVAWMPGDLLGGGRLFFQIPAAASPSYRVRVYTYDRIEAPTNLR